MKSKMHGHKTTHTEKRLDIIEIGYYLMYKKCTQIYIKNEFKVFHISAKRIENL